MPSIDFTQDELDALISGMVYFGAAWLKEDGTFPDIMPIYTNDLNAAMTKIVRISEIQVEFTSTEK